jgi:hypothetical protein
MVGKQFGVSGNVQFRVTPHSTKILFTPTEKVPQEHFLFLEFTDQHCQSSCRLLKRYSIYFGSRKID